MSTLYGLLGQSLKHSISPKIHQAVFDKFGMSAHYHLFEVELNKLKDAVKGLESIGAAGINVTIPYKVEVMQYIDRLSPEAEAIGSVNCIAFDNHETVGYNTDYFGFGMLLERYGIKTDGTKATVLGCGGASKTVISFLLDHGAESIVVATRNVSSNTFIVPKKDSDRVRLVDYNQLLLQTGRDLIINCTPCGMYPNVDEVPVAIDILKNYNTAVDIIYNPLETMFLRHAKEAGLKTVNGLYMLVSQAVAAQEIWNGILLSQSDVEQIYKLVAEYMLQKRI
ncbi:MAG: shikimate dehydrogenase [Clostridia bacterium]